MDEKEFVSTLLSYTTCDECSTFCNAPMWRVARFGQHDWIGLNMVACPNCGIIHCAAAGSSEAALDEAKIVRAKMLKQDFGIKIPESKKIF